VGIIGRQMEAFNNACNIPKKLLYVKVISASMIGLRKTAKKIGVRD